MIDDVVLAKLAVLHRCLHRIQSKTAGEPDTVNDIDIQDIVVLNLQRAIQAAIDLAVYLVAIHGWGLPTTLKENFTLLARQGVIDQDLCRNLEAIVGFRTPDYPHVALQQYNWLI